jgi:tRNA threonylcarbamoyladenosine modification (KEOPS) complex  Pcc1 subunit
MIPNRVKIYGWIGVIIFLAAQAKDALSLEGVVSTYLLIIFIA